jgi:hypothetical protein
MKIYVNGNLDNSNATAATWYTGSYPTVIGRIWTGSTDGSFDGKIDDVRIYNYTLTASQMKQVMNQNSAVRWGPVTGSP